MEKSLEKIFKHLIIADVDIDLNYKHSYNLFEDEYSQRIIFNGHSNPHNYIKIFDKYIIRIEKYINKCFRSFTKNQIGSLKYQLKLKLSSIVDFKTKYFPKEENNIIYSRINIKKDAKEFKNILNSTKKKISIFINVQKAILKRLINIFQTRINIIENAIKSNINFPIIKDEELNSSNIQKKISFDDNNCSISWCVNKGELFLLIDLLNKSGAFINDEGKKPNQTELFSFFKSVLNVNIKHPKTTLNYVKYHQNQDNSVLVKAYENYKEIIK